MMTTKPPSTEISTVTAVQKITRSEADSQAHPHEAPRDPFSGVVVPLVTPLTHAREIDEDAVARLVDHVIAGGVHGILALGTTGEFVSLDTRKRRILLAAIAKAVRGRVALYVGVGDTSIDATRAMVDSAAEAGADAIAVVPPYYFPLTERQLTGFFHSVARTSPLPVMLYNIPGFTRVHVTNRVVREVLDDADNVIGIKDSSGDIDTLRGFIREFRAPGRFRVMVGSEALLWDGLEAGGDGLIPSSANLHPRMWGRFYNAFAVGDFEDARKARTEIDTATVELMRDASGWTDYLRNLKHLLAERAGLCGPWLASPLESHE